METKLTEWNVNDYLKTEEDRALFIEASIEEAVDANDLGIFSDALLALAKSVGGNTENAKKLKC